MDWLQTVPLHYVSDGWFMRSADPCITWEFIEANPDKNWHWPGISRNPNITWEIIQANPNRPWDWYGISINPSITLDTIEDNPDKPWDWDVLLLYKNINKELIQRRPYLRTKERCLIIKESLMETVWHPRRVEKWLEAGVLDAM
jgi:hypothetical protein